MPVKKTNKKSLFYYFFLAVLVLILLCAGFLMKENNKVLGESASPYTLMGWVWSQGYGWISLNSNNCKIDENGRCCGGACGNVSYSVNISTSTNEIYGWGWSSNMGWICFGDGTKYSIAGNAWGCTNTPPYGSLSANFDSITGKITGWAKVLNLDNAGWISLGTSTPSTLSAGYAPVCYNCVGSCDKWTTTGTPPNTATTTPCLQQSTTTFDNCRVCFSQTSIPAGSRPYPGADLVTVDTNIPDSGIYSVGGGSGLICDNCTSCSKVDASSDRIVCSNQCSTCKKYGSALNLKDGSIVGWAWNGYRDVDNHSLGAGWIHFNSGGDAKILAPWLETKYGPIYSEGSIRQWAGSGGSNATYCIFAQSIYGIKTASYSCPQNPITDVAIKYLSTTSTQNIYRNALGKIDVFGLTTSTNPSGSVKYNKYGSVIEDAGLLVGSIDLNNRVFVYNGNELVINGLKIKNGAKYGNGTVVVNGDLRIRGNITYDNTPNPNLNIKQLASIAWIVKGDLIIEGNVTTTVGAFMVLGRGGDCKFEDGTACTPGIEYPKYLQNGYGVVFSGSSGNQLTVYGLIAAKAYDFRRQYTDPNHGAETITYDGRLVANPPPGFKSFIESLPVIRDFEYGNQGL